MIKTKQIYKCSACGNIVEVVSNSSGTLCCCDKPMKLLKENTTEAATEKHIPVIEKTEHGYRVTVGEVEHPMSEEHYIEWIDLVTDNGVLRHFLKPGEKPIAEFKTDAEEGVTARAYCNLHGLWKSNS